MRSLFHFPFPCTTTLAATVPLQPEMCHRPHSAPMRRQRRSPALLSAARPSPSPALTGPRPTVTRSQGARRAAPPSLPRAAARSHRTPSPEYHPAAARTHWTRLARIAPNACHHPHPPMSPPSRFRAHRPPITTIVRRRLTRVALRRPHRAHRVPTSASPPHLSPRAASAPGPWLARIAPYASLFRRMREKGPLPGNFRPKCMLFEIKMATSSPHASISGRNRAIRDTWRANLAAKGPFSRRGARNHAWREDVASAARPFRGSGMRSGRTGFAPCGAHPACLPHAPPLPSRLCPPRPAPPAISPAFIAAVLHASRFTTRIAPTARRHLPRRPIRSGVSRRPGASCRPISDRRIPPAARCPRTLMSICRGPRPTPAPTDARSLAPPGPNPRQPDPSPEPTESRPPVEPSASTRAPPPAAPHPAARVPLRFR